MINQLTINQKCEIPNFNISLKFLGINPESGNALVGFSSKSGNHIAMYEYKPKEKISLLDLRTFEFKHHGEILAFDTSKLEVIFYQ